MGPWEPTWGAQGAVGRVGAGHHAADRASEVLPSQLPGASWQHSEKVGAVGGEKEQLVATCS